MQRNKLIICITAFLLLASIFAVIPAFSSQPPVDTTTYYNGTIGQPRNVDGTLAYDTASAGLIFNIAEPLVFFGDHHFLATGGGKVNLTDYNSLDPATFTPYLAKYLPTIVVNTYANGSARPGSNWTFQINTDIIYQNWTDHLSVVHVGQKVTVEDVIYHFQRMFTFDSFESPQWMFTTPMFGGSGWFDLDPIWDSDEDTAGLQPLATNGAGERLASQMIQDGIQQTSATNVTFFFSQDWPQTGLYQTFAQSWGCIEPKNFCIEHGCWNGTFYDGWSTDDPAIGVTNYPTSAATPLDRHTARSKYSSASAEPAICGTGPYKLTYWDTAAQQWRVDKFENYWRGWAGDHVKTVIVTGVDAWPTRKMMFLQGEFDTCYVPRQNMYDLLDTGAPDPVHTPIPGIQLYYGTLGLQNDMVLINFNMSATGKSVPKINGVPKKDAWGDIRLRRALCSSVNFSTFISGAWYGEAGHPASWWVEGLAPDYKNKTLTPWDFDAALMQSEFAAAGVTALECTLYYNIGNDARRLLCEQIRDNIKLVMGNQFQITVLGEDWPTYLTDQHSDQLAIWNVGWLADFADPDNFARTYCYHTGPFTKWQHVDQDPMSPYIDSLVDLGTSLPNGPERNATYQELQTLFKERAISLPTIQAVGRGWHKDWVRNIEINQLYPDIYYYYRYKNPSGTLKNIDLDITATVTPVTTWPTVMVYKSQMRVGYQGGGVGDATPAKQVFQIHIKRTDAIAGLVAAVIGLKRINLTYIAPSLTNVTFAYPNNTYVLVGPSPDPGITITLTHYEDGATSTLPATETGITWQMSGRTDIMTFDVQDTNYANNVQDSTTLRSFTAKLADINGDGMVDLYDAITLAGVYGKLAGQTGYNADANLNPTPDEATGKQIIDLYDAITLAGQFGQHNQP